MHKNCHDLGMGVPLRVEQLFTTGWLITHAVASITLLNHSWGTSPPKGPLAPQMTKGAPQGRGLPFAMPSILQVIHQTEKRKRMAGPVPGLGGRGAHHETKKAQQKVDETFL